VGRRRGCESSMVDGESRRAEMEIGCGGENETLIRVSSVLLISNPSALRPCYPMLLDLLASICIAVLR